MFRTAPSTCISESRDIARKQPAKDREDNQNLERPGHDRDQSNGHGEHDGSQDDLRSEKGDGRRPASFTTHVNPPERAEMCSGHGVSPRRRHTSAMIAMSLVLRPPRS
jgi:hypothetical protein